MFPRLQYPSSLSHSSSKTVVKAKQIPNTQRILAKKSNVTLKPLKLKANKSQPLALHQNNHRSLRTLLGRSQINQQNSLQAMQVSSDQYSLPDIDPLQQFEDDWIRRIKSSKFNDDEYIVPIQEITDDLNNNITFKLSSLCQSYKVRQANQVLPCMVSLQAKELQKEIPKVGVDLICLIDVSSSMEGEKLTLVKKTLKLLLEFLSPKDRLCILPFNQQPQRLTPLRCVNTQNKAILRQMIDGLTADGGTLIQLAMAAAFESLNQRTYINNVSAIFLLSDGCNNSPWENCVYNSLDQCNQTFTIHSFGFGQDHDALLMTSICQLKNGSFYFVNDITMLDEFFIDALGGLVSVVADDIKIQVWSEAQGVCKDIKIRKVYGEMWNKEKSNQSYSINLQQLSAGHRKDYVFELDFPLNDYHFDDNNRRQIIVKAQIQLRSTQSNIQITKSSELVLDFYNADEQVLVQKDYDVAAQYYRVKAAQAIEQANQLCQQGQYKLALQNLQRLIDKIKKSNKTAILAEATLTDLEQAKQASIPERYRLYGLKQMTQMSCNNYAQLGINSNFSSDGVQLRSQYYQYSNSSQRALMNTIAQTYPII